MLQRLLNRFKHPPGTHEVEQVFSQYEMSMPAHQNAINALPGWNSSFPGSDALSAGNHTLHADGRIVEEVRNYG